MSFSLRATQTLLLLLLRCVACYTLPLADAGSEAVTFDIGDDDGDEYDEYDEYDDLLDIVYDKSSLLGDGPIAGIVIAALLACALVLIFTFHRRRRAARRAKTLAFEDQLEALAAQIDAAWVPSSVNPSHLASSYYIGGKQYDGTTSPKNASSTKGSCFIYVQEVPAAVTRPPSPPRSQRLPTIHEGRPKLPMETQKGVTRSCTVPASRPRS